MNPLIGLSAEELRKVADLKERIDELQIELEQLLGEYGRPSGPRRAITHGRGKGCKRIIIGLTINAAIIQVLGSGPSDVHSITAKVLKLKGKTSKAAIYQCLVLLKNQGRISNPTRGQYAIK